MNFKKWLTYVDLGWHCGRHSNIPWHCILWYVTADWWLRAPQWYRALTTWRMSPHIKGWRYGYIPCPWCLLVRRKPNAVVRCTDACRRRVWLRARLVKRASQSR